MYILRQALARVIALSLQYYGAVACLEDAVHSRHTGIRYPQRREGVAGGIEAVR